MSWRSSRYDSWKQTDPNDSLLGDVEMRRKRDSDEERIWQRRIDELDAAIEAQLLEDAANERDEFDEFDDDWEGN